MPIRKGDKTVNQLSRNLALWLLLILMVLLLVNVFTKQPTRDQEMIFSDFLAAVDKGEVTEVTIQGQDIHGKRSTGESFRTFSPAYPELITDLRNKGVKIDASKLNNDLHGSSTYRAHLVSVMAARAVAAAG